MKEIPLRKKRRDATLERESSGGGNQEGGRQLTDRMSKGVGKISFPSVGLGDVAAHPLYYEVRK